MLANEIRLAGDGHGLVLSGRADCLLRLGDGRLAVVDHKRSSSRGREERMKLGWDLQVELYRAMLARPSGTPPVPAGTPVATAYHCLLDDRLLSHGLPDVPGVDDLGTDISFRALAELRRLAASLGGGHVPLGRAGDRERFRKERGMTTYALDDARHGGDLRLATEIPVLPARGSQHLRPIPRQEDERAAISSLQPGYARPSAGDSGQHGCRRRTGWLSLIRGVRMRFAIHSVNHFRPDL